MSHLKVFFAGIALAMVGSVAFAAPPSAVTLGSAGVVRYIEAGQPPVVIHVTVEQARSRRAAHGQHGQHGKPGGSTTNNLIYQGGTAKIGVETAPKIYLVFWGSQWNKGDPSGEAPLLKWFLEDIGSSDWLNSVTQYCQGVHKGTVFCNGSGTPAGNQSSMLVDADIWWDTDSAAPARPRQSDLAGEAVRAAQHFGNTSASSNKTVQYVIATAHGDNPQGFGRQYCAWHSYTTSNYGNVAYTNLPYITDAGANCGANFNGLGATAGITIVEGHEAAETITDQFPAGGWLDANGSENGDKCAWIASGQGAAAKEMFPDGSFYPVQSLWSNAFNSDSGGCVLSY